MLKSFENFMSLVDRKNLRSNAPKRHDCRLEALEERALLSAVPLSASEYADLRAQYADFNLPENMEDMNVITLDLAEGDDLAALKAAITTAGTTTKSDLIVVRTSVDENTLTYTSRYDELIIGTVAADYGSVTIIGMGPENLTLDANQLCRVIGIDGSSTIVNLGGLTIQNGKTSEYAAGIFNYYGTLTVANSKITGNEASFGGGLYNYGTTTIISSVFSENSAIYGGGIHNDFATLTIENSLISDNTSSMYGGGIGSYGTAMINNSIISGNTGSKGGGICSDGTLSVTNSLISGNTALECGGGICQFVGTLTVSNTTLTRNNAPLGCGICHDSGESTVNNSIIVDEIYKTLGTITGSNNLSTFTDWTTGSNNLFYDSARPLFVDAENGDYHLVAGSQLINNGNNALAVDGEGVALIYDLDGRTRIVNGTVDIGAYEYQGEGGEEPEFDFTVVTTLDDVVDPDDDVLSLREAIEYASEYVTITFADELEGTIVLTLGQLYIDNALVIDGDERITIDADQKSRVFYVSAGTEDQPVVLNGLTIQNGYVENGDGGGIYNNSGTLTVTNSTISGNTASNQGGGIFNRGTLTVTDSTISGNTASYQGGGIYNSSSGTLTVTDSTISGNTASYQGGGIFNRGTLTVTDSTISGNTASNQGGGIYNYHGTLTVTNSTVSENTANDGGGIYNSSETLTVTDSTISGNTASDQGGGIYNSSGTLTVTDSKISGNTASNQGGGIYNRGTLTVTNSTVSENTANDDGGIYNDGTLTVTSSTISGNTATGTYGGGITHYNGNLSILDSEISENSSLSKGGGIKIQQGLVTISNTLIIGNSSRNGGGIFNDTGSVTITNSTISGNTATNQGGGIYNYTSTNFLTLINSIVSSNYADNIYGYEISSSSANNLIDVNPGFVCPILLDSNGKIINKDTMDLHLRSDSIAIDKGDNTAATDIEMDLDGNVRIYGETVDIGAYEYQGDRNDEPFQYSSVVDTLNDSFDLNDDEWSLREAIYYASEYVTITFADELEGTIVLSLGQLYINNTLVIDGDERITIDADQKSRVFYVSAGTEESPVVLNGLTITNGYTDNNGGGIYNRGTLTVTNSTVSENTVSGCGAGIDNSYGTASIINCILSENTAASGGGISSSGTLSITNSEISKNSSSQGGGGIYVFNSILTITNSVISENSSFERGGGIFNVIGSIKVEDSTISGNMASSYGGGIYNSSGVGVNVSEITIIHSEITENTATNNGGGIYNNSEMTITLSEITENTATSYGGGISNYGTLAITNSKLSRNTSRYFGAGIDNSGSSASLRMTGCEVSGNTVASAGGGLSNSGTLSVINSVISGNKAESGGGIFSLGTLTVTNSTISGNIASSNGGVYFSNSNKISVINSIICLNSSGNLSGELASTSRNNLIDFFYPGFICAPEFDSAGELTNADTVNLNLRSDSIAIGKGDNTAIADIETDITGSDRVYGDKVDIGAYEYQGDRNDFPYLSVVNTLNDSFDLSDDEWSLREALYYALNGDTITFADELSGTIDITLGKLVVEKPVTIDGDGRINIRKGTGNNVFSINNWSSTSPVVLTDLTLIDDSGSGTFSMSGLVEIDDCIISGLALDVKSQSDVQVTNSQLGNASISNAASSSLTFEDCIYTGNTFLYSNRNTDALVKNSTIYGIFTIDKGAKLDIGGTININGIVTFQADSTSTGNLFVKEDSTLTGINGQIILTQKGQKQISVGSNVSFALSGITLAGTGIIDGSLIMNNGIIAPDGKISITENYIQLGGMTRLGLGSNTEYDTLNIGGSVNFLGGSVFIGQKNNYIPTDKTISFKPITYSSRYIAPSLSMEGMTIAGVSELGYSWEPKALVLTIGYQSGPSVSAILPCSNASRYLTNPYFDIIFDQAIDSNTFHKENLTLTDESVNPVSIKSLQKTSSKGDIWRVTLGINDNYNGVYHLSIDSSIQNTLGLSMNQNGNLINAESDDSFEGDFTIALPDLSVSFTEDFPPVIAKLGEELAVSWIVENLGDSEVLGSWKDYIYLSKDNKLDSSDYLLASVDCGNGTNYGTALEIGDSYQKTQNVTLPMNMTVWVPGTYYILVYTDKQGVVPEHTEKNNNITSRSIELLYPELADLEVSNVRCASNSVFAGKMVDIIWETNNIGERPASGSWQETVYLSKDGTLATATALKTITFTPQYPLTSQSSTEDRVRRVTVTIPATGWEGDVYFLVKTDIKSQIVDTHQENNLACTENTSFIQKTLEFKVNGSNAVSLKEGDSVTGEVKRTGNINQAVTVTLLNSNPESFSVPETVTIPAGQAKATFRINALTDGIPDGIQTAVLSAQTEDMESNFVTLTAADIDNPTLTITSDKVQVNEGETVQLTIERDFNLDRAVTVNLKQSTKNQFTLPGTVTIPAGSSSVTILVSVTNDATPENNEDVTLSVIATGYQTGTTTIRVLDDDEPTLFLTFAEDTVVEGTGGNGFMGTVTRAEATDESLSVYLTSSNTNLIQVPDKVIIPAGKTSVDFRGAVLDNGLADGTRVVTITAKGIIPSCGCSLPATSTGYVTASLNVLDDDSPLLTMEFTKVILEEGLEAAGYLRVKRNTADLSSAITVCLTSSANDRIQVPQQVTIPAGSQTSAQIAIRTPDNGIAEDDVWVQIEASAEGFPAISSRVLVTNTSAPDLIVSSIVLPESAVAGGQADISWTTVNQGTFAAEDEWTEQVWLSSSPILNSTATLAGTFKSLSALTPEGEYTRTVSILLPDQIQNWYVFITTDVSNTISEQSESNNTIVSTVPLQSRAPYMAIAETSVEKANPGTPVLITGRAAAFSGELIPNVPVEIHITKVNGGTKKVTVQTDSSGEFSYIWTPMMEEMGTYNIGAVYPGSSTIPVQDTLSLMKMVTNIKQGTFYIGEGETVTGSFTLYNVVDIPMTGVTYEVLDLPENLRADVNVVSAIASNGEAKVNISMTALNASVTAATFTLRLSCDQTNPIDIPIIAHVYPATANLTANVKEIDEYIIIGKSRTFEFEITNESALDTGPIELILPDVSWFSSLNGTTLDSLAPGESQTVHLMLKSTDDLIANSDFTGQIGLRYSSTGMNIPFKIHVFPAETATGNLAIKTVDEYYYYGEEKKALANASVKVYNAITGDLVSWGVTDSDGNYNANELAEGYYNVKITADKHESYAQTVQIKPGKTIHQTAFMALQTVTYEWIVTPTEIEDKYDIVIETKYETNVPAPVVVMEPSSIDLSDLTYVGSRKQIDVKFTNYGLIAAHDVTIEFGDHPELRIIKLVDKIDTLAAKSSGTITIIVERVAMEQQGSEPQEGLLEIESEASNSSYMNTGSFYNPSLANVNLEELNQTIESTNNSIALAADLGSADYIDFCSLKAFATYTYICKKEQGVYNLVPVLLPEDYTCKKIYETSWNGDMPTIPIGNLDWEGQGHVGGNTSSSSISQRVQNPKVIKNTPCCVNEEVTHEIHIGLTGLKNSVGNKLRELLKKYNLPVEDIEFDIRLGFTSTKCCSSINEQLTGYEAYVEGQATVTLFWGYKAAALSLAKMQWGNKDNEYISVGAQLSFAAGARVTFEAAFTGKKYKDCKSQDDGWEISLNFDLEAALVVEGEATLAVGKELFKANVEISLLTGLSCSIVFYDSNDGFFTGELCWSGVKFRAKFELEGEIVRKFNLEYEYNEEYIIFEEKCLGRDRNNSNLEELESASLLREMSEDPSEDPFENPEGVEIADGLFEVDGDFAKWDMDFTEQDLQEALEVTEFEWESDATAEEVCLSLGYEKIEDLEEELGVSLTNSSIISYEDIAKLMLAKYSDKAPNGTCAAVTLELSQTAVLTRDAFDAQLTLKNQSGNDLVNVGVDIVITDEDGNDVTSNFGIYDPTTTGFVVSANTHESSLGSLAFGVEGKSNWILIPSTELVNDTAGKVFYVGGFLHYELNGEPISIEMTPAAITVYPQPELELSYFWQRDVWADDPWTDEVEASKPFELIVMVQNQGYGSARNLRIISAQPKIIENEKGLAVDFSIVSSSVNGKASEKTLTANIGDILPGGVAIAQWDMISTLQGLFTDYSANFRHVNGFNDEQFSVIKSVSIHELIHAADVDGDGLSDMLVNDELDVNDVPETLYFSNGTTQPVTYIEGAQVVGTINNSSLSVTVNAESCEEWAYWRIQDTGIDSSKYRLWKVEKQLNGQTVEISDGCFWQTDRVFVSGSSRPTASEDIHILDQNGTGTYVLYFEPILNEPLTAEYLEQIPGKLRASSVGSLEIQFSREISLESFTWEDVSLMYRGSEVPLNSNITVEQVEDVLCRINGLAEFTQEDGDYVLTVNVSGICDSFGNTGEGIVVSQWTKAQTIPTVTQISGIPASLTANECGSITIHFSHSIDSESFGIEDLSLTRNGGENLITENCTLISNSPEEWVLSGLASLTAEDGDYEFTVRLSELESTEGNHGLGAYSIGWTKNTTPPAVLEIDGITREITNFAVDKAFVHFDRAIQEGSFNWQNIVLIRDQETIPLDSSLQVVQVAECDGFVWEITGLSSFTQTDGAYQLGLNLQGITDLIGNQSGLVQSDKTVCWTMDTVPPVLYFIDSAPEALTGLLEGVNNDETDDSVIRTNSSQIPQRISLDKDVTLQVYDETLGLVLYVGSINTGLTQVSFVLQGEGAHQTVWSLTDKAGNKSSVSREYYLDISAPIVLQAGLNEEGIFQVQFSESTDIQDILKSGKLNEVMALTSSLDGELRLNENNVVYDAASKTLSINIKKGNPLHCGEHSLTLRLNDSALISDRAGNALRGSATSDFAVAIYGSDSVLSNVQADSYAVPLVCDFNSDGLMDLLVGEKTNQAEGKVRVYINLGTDEKPVYGNPGYVQVLTESGTEDLTVAAGNCQGAYPRMYDWNRDGLSDLLIGQADGTIRVFYNQGSNETPLFVDGNLLEYGLSEVKTLIDVGNRAAIDIADWNNDGNDDLIVGNLDGQIRVFFGTDSGTMSLGADLLVTTADDEPMLVSGGRAAPVLVDLNHDGLKDLITGNTNGELLVYLNEGAAAIPKFSSVIQATSANQIISYGTGTRSRINLFDFNGDGILDVLIGTADGKVRRLDGQNVFPFSNDGASGDVFQFTDSWSFLERAITSVTTLQQTPFDANDLSENVAFVNEWNVLNLEMWSHSKALETFTITYDSNFYRLNTEEVRNQDGVLLTFGDSRTDESGKTTVEVTIECTGSIVIENNTLLAALEFSPNRNLLVGESVEKLIFVNDLPLDTTVYSVIYDLNESGIVEINDLVAFARLFGQKTSENPDAWKADFNCDERVDISDLVLFARNFGLTTASSSQIRYDANYTPHVEGAQPAAPALPALETSVAWETPTWSGTTQNLVPEPIVALPTITDRAWNDLWSELEEEEEERLAEQLKTAELAWF